MRNAMICLFSDVYPSGKNRSLCCGSESATLQRMAFNRVFDHSAIALGYHRRPLAASKLSIVSYILSARPRSLHGSSTCSPPQTTRKPEDGELAGPAAWRPASGTLEAPAEEERLGQRVNSGWLAVGADDVADRLDDLPPCHLVEHADPAGTRPHQLPFVDRQDVLALRDAVCRKAKLPGAGWHAARQLAADRKAR